MTGIESLARELCSKSQKNHQQFHDVYDELLWAIAAAPEAEIVRACNSIYSEPYLNLPRPLQVTIARFASLVTSKENELSTLASLCDPNEEKITVAPIRDRKAT